MKVHPENEQLAQKQSFESKCGILKTVFQSRGLFSDMYQQMCTLYRGKEKKLPVIVTGKLQVDWFTSYVTL